MRFPSASKGVCVCVCVCSHCYLFSHKKVQHQPDLSVTYEDINHHFLSIAEKTVSSLPLLSTSPLSC